MGKFLYAQYQIHFLQKRIDLLQPSICVFQVDGSVVGLVVEFLKPSERNPYASLFETVVRAIHFLMLVIHFQVFVC